MIPGGLRPCSGLPAPTRHHRLTSSLSLIPPVAESQVHTSIEHDLTTITELAQHKTDRPAAVVTTATYGETYSPNPIPSRILPSHRLPPRSTPNLVSHRYRSSLRPPQSTYLASFTISSVARWSSPAIDCANAESLIVMDTSPDHPEPRGMTNPSPSASTAGSTGTPGTTAHNSSDPNARRDSQASLQPGQLSFRRCVLSVKLAMLL